MPAPCKSTADGVSLSVGKEIAEGRQQSPQKVHTFRTHRLIPLEKTRTGVDGTLPEAWVFPLSPLITLWYGLFPQAGENVKTRRELSFSDSSLQLHRRERRGVV